MAWRRNGRCGGGPSRAVRCGALRAAGRGQDGRTVSIIRRIGTVAALALLGWVLPHAAGAQTLRPSLDLQMSHPAASAGAPAAAATPRHGGYRIAAGDTVSITVYREPDLSVADAKVGPDGVIALPLLGDLPVTGLTSTEVQRLVTEKLADGYLRQPNVTVNVDRQQLYFIKGEVSAPGGYSYVEGLTIEKAIALAGGYTERAAKKDVTVVREAAPGAPLKAADLALPVLPGDVITVEESFF